jgi:hypothetical protein
MQLLCHDFAMFGVAFRTRGLASQRRRRSNVVACGATLGTCVTAAARADESALARACVLLRTLVHAHETVAFGFARAGGRRPDAGDFARDWVSSPETLLARGIASGPHPNDRTVETRRLGAAPGGD